MIGLARAEWQIPHFGAPAGSDLRLSITEVLMSNRHQSRHAVARAVLFATVVGTTATALASGNAPTLVLKSATRLDDANLPLQAMRGTGLTGEFNPTALDAASVVLTLSDGRVIRASRQRVAEDKGKGSKSWVGTFDGKPGSIAAMTRYRGVTTGFVSYGNETWEIMPGKSGEYLLYRVDDSKLPAAEPVLMPATTAGDVLTVSDFGTGGASLDATFGYVHDLLVAYTPASKARYGQATLESMILNAVQVANQAYQNSNVAITLNLVGLQEITYTETGGIRTSLVDLQGASDGKMDGVHRLRDQLGADVVSLISEDGDACGIAYAMRSESSSFAALAFSVVNSGCLSNHSLAHEIGHIQGNMHDRASTTNTGAFAYSYGFRRCADDGTGFRTVMSYACSGANRVAWFSSPRAYFNGFPTGVAYETDPANSADNARSMNNTSDTVAVFRAASSGTSTLVQTVPTAPSSLSVSATSSSAASVRWADNSSDETGFKLERSTNGVDFSEIATLGQGTTSYSDSGLAAVSTYYYRVRAYNSTGNSGYSDVGSVTTPDVVLPPAMPLGIGATDNMDGSATVNWADGSTNETGFEVRREKWDSKRSNWSSPSVVGTVPTGVTSLVDLTGPGAFRYSVCAKNSGGMSGLAGPADVSVTGGATKGRGRRR